MNKSFFTTLLALLFVVTTAGLTAQDANRPERDNRERITPEQRAEKQTERMAKHLDLTEAQQIEVQRINEAFAEEQKRTRENMRVAREAHKAALDAVLTPEQRQKAEELKEKRKAKMKERRGREGNRRERFQRG